MAKERIVPAKGGRIVDRSMSIGEQIKKQANKKGKKTYIIDSEESLDWLLKQSLVPHNSMKSTQKFYQEKQKLID